MFAALTLVTAQTRRGSPQPETIDKLRWLLAKSLNRAQELWARLFDDLRTVNTDKDAQFAAVSETHGAAVIPMPAR